MTLEIIGIPQSNFVRTVRMAAHEKGVTYGLNPAAPHSDEVKAIHPFGLVPVMRHDGLELAESQAIARYMDSAFEGPALIPAEPRAAAPVNQWMSLVATSVDRLIMRRYVVEYIFHKDADGNVVRDEIDEAVKRFPRLFEKLSRAVSAGYLAGNAFSMADCFLVPMLATMQMFPEGKAQVADSSAMKDYFHRIAERPSFAATAP